MDASLRWHDEGRSVAPAKAGAHAAAPPKLAVRMDASLRWHDEGGSVAPAKAGAHTDAPPELARKKVDPGSGSHQNTTLTGSSVRGDDSTQPNSALALWGTAYLRLFRAA